MGCALFLTHGYNTGPCDDGLFCNGDDSCSGGTCSVHAGNPCTGGGECADTCNESGDTCNEPSGTPCTDDGNECTANECNGFGSCGAVTEPAGTPCASDSNVCTNDVCNASGSCTHPANLGPCNDGLFCNGADTCAGGTCSIHAGDPCTGGAVCQYVCNEGRDTCN